MRDREGGQVIWKFGTSGICGVLIAAGVANAEELTTVIRVRLWNYAEVPPRTLADAKRDTSAILERARVRVEWAECRLRESDGPKDTACLLPVTPLPADAHSRPEDGEAGPLDARLSWICPTHRSLRFRCRGILSPRRRS